MRPLTQEDKQTPPHLPVTLGKGKWDVNRHKNEEWEQTKMSFMKCSKLHDILEDPGFNICPLNVVQATCETLKGERKHVNIRQIGIQQIYWKWKDFS